jgi:hypothetical protein
MLLHGWEADGSEGHILKAKINAISRFRKRYKKLRESSDVLL